MEKWILKEGKYICPHCGSAGKYPTKFCPDCGFDVAVASNGKTIGERITDCRMRKHLTMRKLGELIGVDESAICYWEQGKRNPTAASLSALCKALDASADYILGLKENIDD